jgi:hypothetical protein
MYGGNRPPVVVVIVVDYVGVVEVLEFVEG